MNHDAAHCANYKKDCPDSCYRAQLTKELLDYERYPFPVSWVKFGGTDECPLYETPQQRYYEKKKDELREKARAYYQKHKAERLAYSQKYYAENKDALKKRRLLKNEYHA